MKYKNEQQRQMAILEAALPYVSPVSRHSIQLLLQANSFVQLARQNPAEDTEYNLAAAETETEETHIQPDMQGLLLNIQEFLTPQESDIVQTILNFINANKLLQNYNAFMHSHTAVPDADAEFTAADVPNTNIANPIQMLFQLINGLGALGNGFSGNTAQNTHNRQNNMLKEFLMSQLNSEQKATFEQLQNIMYNETT